MKRMRECWKEDLEVLFWNTDSATLGGRTLVFTLLHSICTWLIVGSRRTLAVGGGEEGRDTM